MGTMGIIMIMSVIIVTYMEIIRTIIIFIYLSIQLIAMNMAMVIIIIHRLMDITTIIIIMVMVVVIMENVKLKKQILKKILGINR